MNDKIPLTDSTVVALLRADFLRTVEESPSQHSLRTPNCPSEIRLIAGQKHDDWSQAERQHILVQKCPFCVKVLGMLQRLNQDEVAPEAGPTPPQTAEVAANGAGLTRIARSGDRGELKQRLRPWLPGYLRRAGCAEADADAFLDFILAHLGEMGERRFRDVLPQWLSAFTGQAADPERATIDAAFTAAEAVNIVLGETSPAEAKWTPDFRAHLRQLALPSPEALLDASAPPNLDRLPALPTYRLELYRSALRLHHEGLRLFELAA